MKTPRDRALGCLLLALTSAVLSGCASAPARSAAFVPPAPRLQHDLVLAIRDEIIRLDADGLPPRHNRPESFAATTDQLATEALGNRTAFDFVRTFSRLDATYPNLHAHAMFGEGAERDLSVPGPDGMDAAGATLAVEVPAPDRTRTVLQSLTADPETEREWAGAGLVAINGRALAEWQRENLLFCKWALKTVCDRNLEENLLRGLLDWKGGPLVYTFARGSRRRDVTVSFKKPEPKGPRYERRQCDYKWKNHYPGFELAHKGYFACLFVKSDDPSVALLRVSSFQYKRGKRVDPASPIQSMKQETDALAAVWLPMAARVRHLVVDLIRNGGGNEPMDYYRMLLHKPFQEQYARFKKIPEIEIFENRYSMMNEDPAQELWFQKYKRSGEWDRIPMGGFTKATPMFCPEPSRPCDEVLFEPKAHHFRGRVSVLVDDGCVSTCDAVVFTLKKELGARLYGFSQAADTAYSRLRINAIRDGSQPRGFRLEVGPQRAEPHPDLIVAQDVAVSLSVDAGGRPVAGRPTKLDRFVPVRWDQDYHHDALLEALKPVR